MTDPKPATRATDAQIADYSESLTGWQNYGDIGAMEHLVEMAPSALARIAADAETIRSLDEQRLNNDRIMSNLRLWLADARKERDEARDAVRQQAEEIERLTSNTEDLKVTIGFYEADTADHRKVIAVLRAELATARAQVETLREWIKAEGERAQMCTYAVLREPCPTGKCCAKRRAATEPKG